jgi:hypothetical protein
VRSSTQRRCAKKNGAQAIGRSRGGLTTKVHALVDAWHYEMRTAAAQLYQIATGRCANTIALRVKVVLG